MENIRYLLLVFVVVQTMFIVVDCWTFWRDTSNEPVGSFLRRHRGTIGFLASIWLGYFVIQNLLMAGMPTVEATLGWFSNLLGLPPRSTMTADAAPWWNVGFLFVATYFVSGFWDYWLHRFLHTRQFWFLHENHHLPTQVFNGMPGISVRPFVAPTTFLTYFCSIGTLIYWVKLANQPYLLHAYLRYLPGLMVLFALVGSASHSCFLRRLLWIHFLLKTFFVTTPQEHILHHAKNLSGNYGNFMTFWDRVFGTYLNPLAIPYDQVELGLNYDQDFLGTLTGGRWKISERLRTKYQLGRFCNLVSQTWGK